VIESMCWLYGDLRPARTILWGEMDLAEVKLVVGHRPTLVDTQLS
jgi:hypothetical protein